MLPLLSLQTLNSNHAFPGNFISASSLTYWFSLDSEILHQSKVSPTMNFSKFLLFRLLSPTPPTIRSIQPLMFHRRFAKYQPFFPPIWLIGLKAVIGSTGTAIFLTSLYLCLYFVWSFKLNSLMPEEIESYHLDSGCTFWFKSEAVSYTHLTLPTKA